jgi:cytochrome c oxidase cbb3-type subunit 3
VTPRFTSAAFLCVAFVACRQPGARPTPAEEITDFHSLFASNCSGCHGAEGRNGAAQALSDPLYLKVVPRDELEKTIEHGRPGTPMPAFAREQGGALSPKQVDALVDGIEANWAKQVNNNRPALPPYSAPSGDPKHGQQVFASMCVMCHGDKGRAGPLVNRSYLTLVSNQSMRTTIIVGRPTLGMPDWRHQPLIAGHTDQDISDVVAWLASNRPAHVPTQPAGGPNMTGENQGAGSSSIQAGPGASEKNTTTEKHQ